MKATTKAKASTTIQADTIFFMRRTGLCEVDPPNLQIKSIRTD